MFAQGFNGVVGTGRVVAALSANQWRQGILIKPYQQNKKFAKQFFEYLP